MNDGISHPERSSDGTEGVASAEKGIIINIIKRLRRVIIKQSIIKDMKLSIITINYNNAED